MGCTLEIIDRHALVKYFIVIFYMKHYFKIFAFILALSYITAQESQTTLAILDFEGRGINTLEAATLTDRFTSEIGGSNGVGRRWHNCVGGSVFDGWFLCSLIVG